MLFIRKNITIKEANNMGQIFLSFLEVEHYKRICKNKNVITKTGFHWNVLLDVYKAVLCMCQV